MPESSEDGSLPSSEDLRPAVELRAVSKGYTRDLRRGQRNGLAAIGAELRLSRDTDRQHLRSGEFWAVRDVSLAVHPGDALGIVGVNGAGKSTLLRLIAGITQPTSGEVVRLASIGTLLDPNAGFNPVLSGRENAEVAYTLLRGSLPPAGLVDEVLAYADIVAAADHPVRTYSNGMRLRLGFSVMVFVDPDVLVIDEALAVGDTSFQLQCLDHLHSYCRAGGSLVFTSHSMMAFQNVATRGIHLSAGEVVCEGSPDEVTDHYLTLIRSESAPGTQHGPDLLQREVVIRRPAAPSVDPAEDVGGGGSAADRPAPDTAEVGDGRPVRFERVEILGPDGGTAVSGEEATIRLDLASAESFDTVTTGIMVWTADLSTCVFADISHETTDGGGSAFPLARGRSSISCRLSPLPLTPGEFAVRAAVYDGRTGDILGLAGIQDTPWWFTVVAPPAEAGAGTSTELVGALRPLRLIEAQVRG